MALTSYMKIIADSQGEIKGDCPHGGDKKDRILVYNIDHCLEIIKDSTTGLPTGVQHLHPFTITKHKDQATPKLVQMLATGETASVELLYFRIRADGTEENYFTMQLGQAVVVAIREFTPMTFLTENKPFQDMEEISFLYESCRWLYNDGQIDYMFISR